MGGGLLNLIATGNQNVILNGNPKKTFFRSTYSKYTNFGLQKFRIDYNILNTLRLSEDSIFEFVIPKQADLMLDTYFIKGRIKVISSACPESHLASTGDG